MPSAALGEWQVRCQLLTGTTQLKAWPMVKMAKRTVEAGHEHPLCAALYNHNFHQARDLQLVARSLYLATRHSSPPADLGGGLQAHRRSSPQFDGLRVTFAPPLAGGVRRRVGAGVCMGCREG